MSDATVIKVELLSGRYHAHLWGEAQFGMAGPEWPPSPWRLLRAIASAWFSGVPPSSERERDDLLEKLGRADPPELWLPQTSFREIRYYQPLGVGASDRVLHHDFYAVPEGGCFCFRFNVSLAPCQRLLLEALLGRLRYFGRSESRARLRVVDYVAPPAGMERVVSRRPGESIADRVYRYVLCTAPDFQATDLWTVRGSAREATQRVGYPPHLIDVLLDKRMPLPCGTRWVEYAVPEALLVHDIWPCGRPAGRESGVELAELHFRLNRRVPTPVELLVAVARAFRDAAVANYRGHSRTLTGREADGSVARGHQHAFYLPRLSKNQLTVESLVVRIPTGRLRKEELDALLGVNHIRIDGSPYPITLVVERIVRKREEFPAAIRWRSVTPFLPALRHRGYRETLAVEEQAAACAQRLCGVRPLVWKSRNPSGFGEVSLVKAHQYFDGHVRGFKRGWRLTRRVGFWLELAFDEPVVLTRPLGADAHFGAGQFEPMDA